MLHIPAERLTPLPFVFSSEPSDPLADEKGDQPATGGKIKPPTVNQPASSEGDAGIKPPTVSSTSDDGPPEASGQEPIIITGGD